MTLDQLNDLIHKAKFQGLDSVVLKMPSGIMKRSTRPIYVRTPFGRCRWVPSAEKNMIVIFPKLYQIKSFLRKVEKVETSDERQQESGHSDQRVGSQHPDVEDQALRG